MAEEGQNAVGRENSLRKWEMIPDLKERRLMERNFPSSAIPRGTSNIKVVGLDFFIGMIGY